MYLGSPAECFGAGFGKTEVPDFARFDQFGHGSDGFFNGNLGVDAVLIVKVDDFDAQTLEATFYGAADVGGRAVRAAARAVGVDAKTELGGDHHGIPRHFAKEFADQLFVGEGTVDFGGIEEVAAQFEVTVQYADGFVVVGGTVSPRHAHAAKTQSGHRRAVLAEFSDLHRLLRTHEFS